MDKAVTTPHVSFARHGGDGGGNSSTLLGVDTPGWDGDATRMPDPLIEGISNEEVWMMVRRLDNVTFHLKAIDTVPASGLDLEIAPEQEFSPNKMRSQIERFYIGTIVGTLACVKHISRLRSWNEKTRTAAFCTVYFTMWLLDFLPSAGFLLLILLIVAPDARRVLFPPAPIALVDTLHGGLTRPNAGILGSVDSITGAPESSKGEAVEKEASNFIVAFASIATNIATGSDPQGEPNTEEDSLNLPMTATPNDVAIIMSVAKDKAEGVDSPSFDKTKKAMGSIMWSKIRPAMHLVMLTNDLWDRLGTMLVPRPPFSNDAHRLRLAAVLAPFAAASMLIPRDTVIRSSTFLFGLAFFGQPLFSAVNRRMNQNFSKWTSVFNINNTLLHGVPTRPQLALALLRLAEAKGTPLPPAPHSDKPPQEPLDLTDEILATTGNDLPLGATDQELTHAIGRDEAKLEAAGGNDAEVTKTGDSTEPHRGLRFMKRVAKVGVRGAIALDKTRAKLGNSGARNRVGIATDKYDTSFTGPVEFHARYEGEQGYLCIMHGAGGAMCLAFNRESSVGKSTGELRTVWTVAIDDITELRKHGGYGFKTKLVAGWALDKQLSDSLGITDNRGEDRAMTAIPNRDVLFNRLMSIGRQKWEVR